MTTVTVPNMNAGSSELEYEYVPAVVKVYEYEPPTMAVAQPITPPELTMLCAMASWLSCHVTVSPTATVRVKSALLVPPHETGYAHTAPMPAMRI